MKKTILTTIIALGAVMLFTGCGSKHNWIMPTKADYCDEYKLGETCKVDNPDAKIVSAYREDGFIEFENISMNSAMKATFQLAAVDGKREGYSYFSIIAPAPVATAHGVMIDNTKEFIDKCSVNALSAFSRVGTNQCGLRNFATTQKSRRTRTIMAVQYYKQQPFDVMTFSIDNVLKYFKDNPDEVNLEGTTMFYK